MAAGEVGGPAGVVRSITASDEDSVFDAFRDLLRDPTAARYFHPHQLDRATAGRIASRPGRDVYLGYFQAGRLLGYAMLRGWEEGYEVPAFGVAVLPEARDRGIGSLLLREALATARGRGAREVMVKIHGDNRRTLDWHLAEGFRITGSTEDGHVICHLSLGGRPRIAPAGGGGDQDHAVSGGAR